MLRPDEAYKGYPALALEFRIYNGYWYWARPTPELRPLWERGERSMFFPYPDG